MNDIKIVPRHLSHKISQEAWDWINEISSILYKRYLDSVDHRYPNDLHELMIRGYWLISYFCNPSEENFNYMMKALYEYKMIRNNFDYFEFRYELNLYVQKLRNNSVLQ